MIVHTCNPRGRGREEDHKLEDSLGSIKRHCLRKKKKKERNKTNKTLNYLSLLQ
jgi:hypothetical protein